MMYSMTAFARATEDVTDRRLVWELKSVNHRYLEVQFRLPEPLRALEGALREVARKHLKRGKLDCTLRVDHIAGSNAVNLNREILLQVLAAVEQVKRDAPDIGNLSPMELIRWPGVLDEVPADDDRIIEGATQLFEGALSNLLASRQREGERLKAIIAERLDDIDSIITSLKPLVTGLAGQQKDKLMNRLKELEANVDPTRFEQEVALLAQRADVAEELDRLGIHIEEARRHVNGQGPHGRRLDFLTQELNREANTLGAKSIMAETSQRAVDLKVLIEQIREQVQNIE